MGGLLRVLNRRQSHFSRLFHLSSSRSVTTARPTLSLDPSQSELLRATLLGSVNSRNTSQPNIERDQRVLELLDSQWRQGSPPPQLWYALKGIPSSGYKEGEGRLPSIATLSSLKDVTERLVVDAEGAEALQRSLGDIVSRCSRKHQSTEILTALGDIIARLQRLRLPIGPETYELGMYFAAKSLSSPTFHRFFTGLLELAPRELNFDKSFEIVRVLNETVNQELFESPHYDTTHILAEITGEYDAISESGSVRLHDILHSKLQSAGDSINTDLHSWTTYLCLLSTLRSGEPLTGLWRDFIERITDKSESALHSTYGVVLALVRARRSEAAARFLEDISIFNGDSLPHFTTFANLQEILEDPVVGETLADIVADDQYEALLELAFENMEQRLGIRWEKTEQPDNEIHRGITTDSTWSSFEDQPLLTIDGDCAGYDDPTRLYAELQASGCSRSSHQLGRIVELLHEQDGQGLEVVPDGDYQSSLPELRWCPQHSPVEFSHAELSALSDRTREWTPESLGLIWIRPLINGVPQTRGKSFHLMQLGSLDMRSGPHESWQPSGYIVGWDRQSGHMNAVFVGTDHGLIDRGPMPSNTPFGSMLRIRPSHMPNSGAWSSVGPFYLDLDPSLDLGFQ